MTPNQMDLNQIGSGPNDPKPNWLRVKLLQYAAYAHNYDRRKTI